MQGEFPLHGGCPAYTNNRPMYLEQFSKTIFNIATCHGRGKHRPASARKRTAFNGVESVHIFSGFSHIGYDFGSEVISADSVDFIHMTQNHRIKFVI